MTCSHETTAMNALINMNKIRASGTKVVIHTLVMATTDDLRCIPYGQARDQRINSMTNKCAFNKVSG